MDAAEAHLNFVGLGKLVDAVISGNRAEAHELAEDSADVAQSGIGSGAEVVVIDEPVALAEKKRTEAAPVAEDAAVQPVMSSPRKDAA